jgi:2-methylcitrate dehydratase
MTQPPAVERIAVFAATARPEHLTSDIHHIFKRNILDSLGSTIAALPGPPFQGLREQFEEYRTPGQCTSIGGGNTSADQAALFNSASVRYVDLLDSYLAPGGLCHPSDNFGTVLAATEQAGASGEEFMLALAVAYDQCGFSAAVPVMVKGFNHAAQLAIATVDNASLACVHAETGVAVEGFSPGMTGMRAIYAASLAGRGFQGQAICSKVPMGWSACLANQCWKLCWISSVATVWWRQMSSACAATSSGEPSISWEAGATVRKTTLRPKSKQTTI